MGLYGRRINLAFLVSMTVFFLGVASSVGFVFSDILFKFLSVACLISGGAGLVFLVRKVLMINRANPEAVEAMRAQGRKMMEKQKALSLTDIPQWLVALLFVAVVFSALAEIGVFNPNPLLAILVVVLMCLFDVYYVLYIRRVKNKKYNASSDTANNARF
jgi:uncharacterized membrane protein